MVKLKHGRNVMQESVLLLVVGLTAGTGLAAWAGRAASSLVYGIKPRDPMATFTLP